MLITYVKYREIWVAKTFHNIRKKIKEYIKILSCKLKDEGCAHNSNRSEEVTNNGLNEKKF